MPTSLRSTRRNKFSKSERLCSRKAIEALFAGGNKSYTAFPLRVVFRPLSEQEASSLPGTAGSEVQLLISVPKRLFKHAVDRNRAKRQVREAWRLNRGILNDVSPSPTNETITERVTSSPRHLHIAFLWLAAEPQPSDFVRRRMRNLLHRVKEETEALTGRSTEGLFKERNDASAKRKSGNA